MTPNNIWRIDLTAVKQTKSGEYFKTFKSSNVLGQVELFELEILFDLVKPSRAISGAFIFGPLISSDSKITLRLRPSKRTIALFGVEYDLLFLKGIFFSLNNLLKLSNKSCRKFFCKEEGISSLNNSKKNSDI